MVPASVCSDSLRRRATALMRCQTGPSARLLRRKSVTDEGVRDASPVASDRYNMSTLQTTERLSPTRCRVLRSIEPAQIPPSVELPPFPANSLAGRPAPRSSYCESSR